eukprot:CAMPEP_0172315722 /NCGR_PEP_ID=MMETSP1058-20130122/26073_1 /TAXON_ID=83371 /ORGANISM="Detonula confervacea, Strain CCMP 353" /LENGTH=311 /DNA_ID=CAMNT_0013029869 /DNA_START=102 /DNA_END=1037 /DNA_ORIENTATION=-
MSQCASCEKGGNGLKMCNICKQVNYCNASCQRAHWPEHKSECRKRAAEIFDETLFKEPSPREDCPICFVRLPCASLCNYQLCCGQEICNGCCYSVVESAIQDHRNGETNIEKTLAITDCPFCREPCQGTDEEALVRIIKRMESNDGNAFHMAACSYLNGEMSLPQDTKKSFELWVRATELGSVEAYNSLSNSYLQGRGVERDVKKAKHYMQLAAMGGQPIARYNLGYLDERAGKMNRAVKHYVIAARIGFDKAMEEIQKGFERGLVSEDEFMNTFRAHMDYKREVKTDQRDKHKNKKGSPQIPLERLFQIG